MPARHPAQAELRPEPPAPFLHHARMAVAGVNTRPLRHTVLNLANPHPPLHRTRHRARPAAHTRVANRLDAHLTSRDACLFLDWLYLCKHDRRTGAVTWKSGQEAAYHPAVRILPLCLDCGSYRRFISRKATTPAWALPAAAYYAAIELIRPEAYAAIDIPGDRWASRANLQEMLATFPHDANDRLWPVFSTRWVDRLDDAVPAHLLPPAWRTLKSLATLIPQPAGQEHLTDAEAIARKAIGKALALHANPEFRWLCERFGRVMIGALNKAGNDQPGEIDRPARHILAAMLAHLHPETHFWYLGQGSNVVLNGLGLCGLVGPGSSQRVWLDGTWWLQDARAEKSPPTTTAPS